ncbi:MAG TPA: hypothetical protein VHQ65_12600 [Thermoanaerobaculia bacterium]|nr:hypothetical protein [Thermoanaerobaculia bacterium]
MPVYEGSESVLPRIVLRQPLPLDVLLDPFYPGGEPWTVELLRVGSHRPRRRQEVALAPGYPLTSALFAPGREADLPLAAAAGDLVIGRQGVEPGFPGLLVVREDDGSVLNAVVLHQWAQASGRPATGGTVLLPRLQPGSYRVCWVPPAALAAVASLADVAPAWCRSGYLPAGGELRVDLRETGGEGE